jgi:hypothetical protein
MLSILDVELKYIRAAGKHIDSSSGIQLTNKKATIKQSSKNR